MSDKEYKPTALDPWLILFLNVPMGLLFGGYVLYKLWGWFAVPALHVPAISWGQSMGLCVMVGALVSSVTSTRRHMPWWEHLAASLVLDGFALLAGLIIHAAIT